MIRMNKTILVTLVLLAGLFVGLVFAVAITDSVYQMFGVSLGTLIFLLPVVGAGTALMLFLRKQTQ
ncbi:hypothetical protein [Bacillus smithii]|uniref:hypothetical protein n=1 Tax=Bacillus smithii TaxID=1479 RepID=UPI0030C8DCCB